MRAHEEMTRVLKRDGGVDAPDRGWAEIGHQRFRHEPLHDDVAAMSDHVVMAYFDTPRSIERRVGGRVARSVTANDTVTVIPAGSTARWDIHGRLDVIHVYIAPDRLQRVSAEAGLAADRSLVEVVAHPSATLSRLLRMLGSEPSTGTPMDRLYLDTLSELVCVELVRSHSSAAGGRSTSIDRVRAGGLSSRQLKRVSDYMLANIGRQVGLEELARQLSLSPKHFCTSFRVTTGHAPHAWLRRHRVALAQTLLEENQISLADIALSVGYESQSGFGAMFKSQTGCTPGEWRGNA